MVQHGSLISALCTLFVVATAQSGNASNSSSSDAGGGATISSSSLYPFCTGNDSAIQDGVCNFGNNNQSCDYDGGDCCACTCEDGPVHECGTVGIGYFCIDPSASCANETLAPTMSPATTAGYPNCTFGSIDYIADGDCDLLNNNADCDYDGGDCCECTCVPTINFDCDGIFICQDPDASCYGDTPAPSVVECVDDWIGDGSCDPENNNELCHYDGGDCCECTCFSANFICGGGYYSDSFWECMDPDSGCAPTPAPSTPELDNCNGFIPHIHDGFCDENNNNEACLFDGGDCCECTCSPGENYDCGQNDDNVMFNCRDPEASCATSPSTEPSTSPLKTGSVIGIVSGGGVMLCCVGGVVVFLCFGSARRKSKKQDESTSAAGQEGK